MESQVPLMAALFCNEFIIEIPGRGTIWILRGILAGPSDINMLLYTALRLPSVR
jgi:hypothetical protein